VTRRARRERDAELMRGTKENDTTFAGFH
jgi:hypothetical protein